MGLLRLGWMFDEVTDAKRRSVERCKQTACQHRTGSTPQEDDVLECKKRNRQKTPVAF
jgi:hypothetical protein